MVMRQGTSPQPHNILETEGRHPIFVNRPGHAVPPQCSQHHANKPCSSTASSSSHASKPLRGFSQPSALAPIDISMCCNILVTLHRRLQQLAPRTWSDTVESFDQICAPSHLDQACATRSAETISILDSDGSCPRELFPPSPCAMLCETDLARNVESSSSRMPLGM